MEKKLKLRDLAPKGSNKTEQAFSQLLARDLALGTITWWDFEPMKLRLGEGAWYTPDFGVMLSDQSFEFYEVKGFWREAARVRIKVAAERYPMFQFTAVKKDKELGWVYEIIGRKPSVLKV